MMFCNILVFLAAFSAAATAHKERVGGFRLKQFINKFSDSIPFTGLTSSIVGSGIGSTSQKFVAAGREKEVMGNVIRIRGGMSNPKQAGAALFLTSLLNSYTGMLETSPYPTKIITSAIIGAVGDYIVQIYQSRKSNASIDFRRVMVFATVCGLYIAPVIHVWFNYLNGIKFLSGLGNVQKALSMMLVDQSIGATVITLGFFFAFEAAQAVIPPYSGKTNFLAAGWNSAKSNMKITMIANWSCWPVINFINFLVVPLEYRVLFSNFAAVFWNMFLSQIANRDIKKP